MAVVVGDTESKTQAPLLVGVTGKLDLKGADTAVRAALDLALARLDARCPTTPKILLTGMARGADSVAAEAALARSGWSVIGVLPFSRERYLEDFEGATREQFETLTGDARVRTIELPPLRQSPDGAPYADAELERAPDGPHPVRDDHYEQVGLFIAERSGLLLAVMEASEAPGKIGGTARIAYQRVKGELDEAARGIVARSAVLVEPPRLTDRHAGPVWLIDLAVAAAGPEASARSLLAWAPGHGEPKPIGEEWATTASLALPDAIEGVNRNIARIKPSYWAGLGRHEGDAASEVRRLQKTISDVQVRFMNRVRASIWVLAGLSCLAIFALEMWVAQHKGWQLLSVYLAFVAVAVVMYWRVSAARWQRIAEDYRAVAETLRVQAVWWASGMTSPRDRVDRYYLRGAHGAFRQLRALITSLIDGALLRYQAPLPSADAAESWSKGQIAFFDKRITSRRRELVLVDTASWFLFAASFCVAACLALGQVPALDADGLLERVRNVGDAERTVSLVVLTAAGVALFLLADRLRETAEERAETLALTVSNVPAVLIGLLGGLLIAAALATLATLLPAGPTPLQRATELLAVAVIMAATVAGAIRYVSEKMSWASELTGYERARRHFERGLASLSAVADPAERREIVLTMGAEALSENENWLHAHRERPLEPIVGG